jgi:hypothetical protein
MKSQTSRHDQQNTSATLSTPLPSLRVALSLFALRTVPMLLLAFFHFVVTAADVG